MSGSELLAAKIKHGFDHLDVNKDGVLTEDDHVLMGKRVAESLGHLPGSDEERQIIGGTRSPPVLTGRPREQRRRAQRSKA